MKKKMSVIVKQKDYRNSSCVWQFANESERAGKNAFIVQSPLTLEKNSFIHRDTILLTYSMTTPVKSMGVDLHYVEETFAQLFSICLQQEKEPLTIVENYFTAYF